MRLLSSRRVKPVGQYSWSPAPQSPSFCSRGLARVSRWTGTPLGVCAWPCAAYGFLGLRLGGLPEMRTTFCFNAYSIIGFSFSSTFVGRFPGWEETCFYNASPAATEATFDSSARGGCQDETQFSAGRTGRWGLEPEKEGVSSSPVTCCLPEETRLPFGTSSGRGLLVSALRDAEVSDQ